MRWKLALAAVLLLAVFAVAVARVFLPQEARRSSPRPADVHEFAEISAAFRHLRRGDGPPTTGAAAIDVDGDGALEVFVGGGEGQPDALLAFREGWLANAIEGTGLSSDVATHGATAVDMDQDGDTDLLVARRDGVSLYLNQDGRFEEQKIPLSLAEGAVPFDVRVSDIDRDGDGDLYVSVFAKASLGNECSFGESQHAMPNVMLLHEAGGTFRDITELSGTASLGNTHGALFVDLDQDGWQDLVLAQDAGEVEIFRNLGDRRFESIHFDSGYGCWMGVASGDIDADGDQDLLFTNVGRSLPGFLVGRGLQEDQLLVREWLLLRNDADLDLTDVTESYGLTGFGFARGAVFEDLDLDGRLDLLVAQNSLDWLPHKLHKLPGKALLQMTEADRPVFHQTDALGLANPHFGQSPLIVDVNGDGRQDVLWLNIDGPLRVLLNASTGNFVTVALPDNIRSLGARVTVETRRGERYTRQAGSGGGARVDGTPELSFGLGSATSVERILVEYPNGDRRILAAKHVNRRIEIRE